MKARGYEAGVDGTAADGGIGVDPFHQRSDVVAEMGLLFVVAFFQFCLRFLGKGFVQFEMPEVVGDGGLDPGDAVEARLNPGSAARGQDQEHSRRQQADDAERRAS